MSKEQVIDQIAGVFRQYGYDGTTLKRLSDVTGLGKASLYHYFPNGKEEMADAVLRQIGQCFNNRILAPLKGEATPSDRIRAMTIQVSDFYQHGQKNCLLAALALGTANELFHPTIQRYLQVWIEALARVVEEAGLPQEQARQRAEDAVLQIQGALILSRGLGHTGPFERVLQQMPDDLTRPL